MAFKQSVVECFGFGVQQEWEITFLHQLKGAQFTDSQGCI